MENYKSLKREFNRKAKVIFNSIEFYAILYKITTSNYIEYGNPFLYNDGNITAIITAQNFSRKIKKKYIEKYKLSILCDNVFAQYDITNIMNSTTEEKDSMDSRFYRAINSIRLFNHLEKLFFIGDKDLSYISNMITMRVQKIITEGSDTNS